MQIKEPLCSRGVCRASPLSSSSPWSLLCLFFIPPPTRRRRRPSPLVVTWLLAPAPPCEQMPAVVGGGCWAAVTSFLTSLVVSYHPSPSVIVLPPTPRAVAREAGTDDVSFAVVLPWLWLVDLPISMVVVIGCKHPRSTLRAVARRAGSGCWVVRHCHGALEVGLAHPHCSLWPVLFVAGPLAPPIHPASRCSQLWRGAVVVDCVEMLLLHLAILFWWG
jgi:hypothetical protein